MDYNGPTEFTYMAKALAASRGSPFDAWEMIQGRPAAPNRVLRVLKAAVDAGTLADPAWAGRLADYSLISGNFLTALRTRSVFQRALDDGAFMRCPLHTRFLVSSTAIVGDTVGEQQMKPLSTLSLSGPTLRPKKMAAQVAITDELARTSGGAADAIVSRELVNGVSAATDLQFLNDLAAVPGLQSVDGDSNTAGQFLGDLSLALDLMDIGATSRIYCVCTPSLMKTLALDATTLAAADLTLQGGTIGGVVILPSNEQAPEVATVFDASRIAADGGVVTVRVSTQADLQLSDDPSAAENQLVSLFQTNMVGIIAERYAGWEITSANSVVEITGASA